MEGVTDSSVISGLFGAVTGGASSSSSSTGKRLIIMDEVDGMSTGDRGGNAELIKIIQASRTPIIAICNDREKPTVRSLANYCLDIRFKRCDRAVLASRMVEVAALEGLTVERAAMDQLVESCGGDIRQILNTLQMWAVKKDSCSVRSADMAARLESLAKDGSLRLDAFTAAPKMFAEARSLSLSDRMDFFFVDYDMIPLLVQQSYVATAEKASGPDFAKLLRICKAADCISDSDLMEGYVRGRQAWGLLPSVAASYTRAATWAQGPASLIPFPSWLGKNSQKNKRARLLAEMGVRMASHVSGGREAVRMDYFDFLRFSLFRPLGGNPADPPAAFNEVMEILDAYSLSRTDMFETMSEVVFKEADFTPACLNVESKVKAAFTRAYKQAAHRSQALVALLDSDVKKGRGGSGGRKVIITEDGEEEDDVAGDAAEDGEDEEAADADEGDLRETPSAPVKVAAAAAKKDKAGGKAKAAPKPRAPPKKKPAAAAAKKKQESFVVDDDEDDEDDCVVVSSGSDD